MRRRNTLRRLWRRYGPTAAGKPRLALGFRGQNRRGRQAEGKEMAYRTSYRVSHGQRGALEVTDWAENYQILMVSRRPHRLY